jgi:osmotically-inducible protein OsmY
MDTDTQVLQDLIAEFHTMVLLHSARLNVQVEDGIVTISGRVNTFAQRKAVERVARRVAGTRTLIFQIGASVRPRLGQGDQSNATDAM